MENNVEHPTAVGDFRIDTEAFSGPLELLIALIEKRKFLVNDISLAAVTDEYICYVAELEKADIRETTQFVALASTLLLIKSKSLLPVLELTDDEEDSIEDLQERLKLYQIFRDAGEVIRKRYGTAPSYASRFVPSKEPLFITDSYTNIETLFDGLRHVILNLPKKHKQPKVQVRKVVSLDEMISRLRSRVEQDFKLGFGDFTNNSRERGTVIVGFLAVLEMVKQGNVVARQTTAFTDIEIERDANNTPRYI